MREFISKTNPQVVHAHFGSRGWEALPLCERYGLPLVTSFYGHDASALPRVDDWMHRYQELFAKGDAFVVEGPAMKERLILLGCPASKISIVPLVVRPERYRYVPQQLRAGDTLRVLFVGRFVEKKGLPILLNALKQAREALSPVELRIIGDGANRAEIESLVSCLELTEMVHFLGLLPREEVLRQLEASHLLAVPSRTAANGDTEGGAPTILGEAMACGTVIAATRHADIPFVIPMYQDYLADENDVTGFARLLVRLRERTDQWPELLAKAYRHVQDQHGADTIHRLETIYDRCHQLGTESTLESKAA